MTEEPGFRPGLVDSVVRIAAQLPARQARAWAVILRRHPGPDQALEAELIAAAPGGGSAPLASTLVAQWRREPDVPGAALALALLTASETSERAERLRAQVVVTGPSTPEQPTRLTSAAVFQLVASARRELLLVSFAAYRSAGLVGALAAATDRGVRIDLVLEGSTGAVGAFSALQGRARFWHWPQGERGANGKAALHAKVIAADRSSALVGSANLTERALNENIEVGVFLRDPRTVGRIVGHFRALMGERGPLKPLGVEREQG